MSAVFMDYGNNLGSARISFKIETISDVTIIILEYDTVSDTTAATTKNSITANNKGGSTSQNIYIPSSYFAIGKFYKFQIKTAVDGFYTNGGTTALYINTTPIQYSPKGYDIIVVGGQSNMTGADNGYSFNSVNNGVSHRPPTEGVIYSSSDIEDEDSMQFYYPQYTKPNTRYHSKTIEMERIVPITDKNGNAVHLCKFKGSTESGQFDTINAYAPFSQHALPAGGGNNGVSLAYEFVKYYANSQALASNRQVIVVFGPWGGTGFTPGSPPNPTWLAPDGAVYKRIKNATNNIIDSPDYLTPVPVTGLKYFPLWSPLISYNVGDNVCSSESSYICTIANINKSPAVSTNVGPGQEWSHLTTLHPSIIQSVRRRSSKGGNYGLMGYNTYPPYCGGIIVVGTLEDGLQLIKDNCKCVWFANEMKTNNIHPTNYANIAGDVPDNTPWIPGVTSPTLAVNTSDDYKFVTQFLPNIINGTQEFDFMYNYDFNDYKFSRLVSHMNFLQVNGIKVRCHCLFYNYNLPEWFKNEGVGGIQIKNKKQALYAIMRHCYVVVKWLSTNYPGLVVQYDVTNEHSLLSHPYYQNGETQAERETDITYVYAALVGARMADPNALLFIAEVIWGARVTVVTDPILANLNFRNTTTGKSRILDGVAIQYHLKIPVTRVQDSVTGVQTWSLSQGSIVPWIESQARNLGSYCITNKLKAMFGEVDVTSDYEGSRYFSVNSPYVTGPNFISIFGAGIPGMKLFEEKQSEIYLAIYNAAAYLYDLLGNDGEPIGLPYITFGGNEDTNNSRTNLTGSGSGLVPYTLTYNRVSLFDRSFRYSMSYNNDQNYGYDYSITAEYPSTFRGRAVGGGRKEDGTFWPQWIPTKEYWDGPTNTRKIMKKAFIDLRRRLIERAREKLVPTELPTCNRVVSFLWHQGENNSAPAGKTWHGCVNEMLQRFITDIGTSAWSPRQKCTFVIGELLQFFSSSTSSDVNKRIVSFVPPDSYNIARVSSLGLDAIDRNGTFVESIHFSARSSRLFGLRYFNAYSQATGYRNTLANKLRSSDNLLTPKIFNYNVAANSGTLSFLSTANSAIPSKNPVGYQIVLYVVGGSAFYALITEAYSTRTLSNSPNYTPTVSNRVVIPYVEGTATLGANKTIYLKNGTTYNSNIVYAYGTEFSYSGNVLYSRDTVYTPGNDIPVLVDKSLVSKGINNFIVNSISALNADHYSHILIKVRSLSLLEADKDRDLTAGSSLIPGFTYSASGVLDFPPILTLYLNSTNWWPPWTDVQSLSTSIKYPNKSYSIPWDLEPNYCLFDGGNVVAENTLIMVGLVNQSRIQVADQSTFTTEATYASINYKRIGSKTSSGSLPFFGTRGTEAWSEGSLVGASATGLVYSRMTKGTDFYFFASNCTYDTTSQTTGKTTQNSPVARQFAGISSLYSSLNPAGNALSQYTGINNDKFLFFNNTGSQVIVNIKNILTENNYTISYYFSVKSGKVPVNVAILSTSGMYLSNYLPVRLHTASPLGLSLGASTIGHNLHFGSGTRSVSANITTEYLHPTGYTAAAATQWNGGWKKLSFSFSTVGKTFANSTGYLQLGPIPITRAGLSTREYIDTSFNFAGFQLTVSN